MTDEKRLERPDNDVPRPERTPIEVLRDWEVVQQNETDETARLAVVGGWLYRTGARDAGAVAMVFVPWGASSE